MKTISFRQDKPGKKDIANLHKALQKIGYIINSSEINNQELGKTTNTALQKHQRKAGLKADGKPTPETIDALNKTLEHVNYASSKSRVKNIHSALTRLNFKLDPEEIRNSTVGGSTEGALRGFQTEVGLPKDGYLNDFLYNKLKEEAMKKENVVQSNKQSINKSKIGRIEGLAIYDNELPAKMHKITLYNISFGKTEMIEEATTDKQGYFGFDFEHKKELKIIELSAQNGEGEEILLSKVKLIVPNRLVINLAMPSLVMDIFTSEYEKLLQDLNDHTSEGLKLPGAQEDDERHDISVLNRATSWDARLIALMVKSAQLSEETGVSFTEEEIYGFLRAGLPSEVMLLAQVEPDIAENMLIKARASKIINLTDEGIRLIIDKLKSFTDNKHIESLAQESETGEVDDLEKIRPLQRFYQITPCLETMSVLSDLKMNSAHDVAMFSEDKFMELFEENYYAIHNKQCPQGLGGMIYRRAQKLIEIKLFLLLL